ncbi:hypothetical protein VNO77_37370 [Canavalia gladiata]|uniref:RING-type domain-containing protein n=1 Tax=Canavalia gladiata TaxID=3824 RepID=A0AAN9K8V7_CANGL
MENNRSRVPRIHIPLIPPSPPPAPFPPMIFSIATLATTLLIFICIYYFSFIVSVVILLALCITSPLICRFIPDMETPLRERPSFYAQTPQNNQRVVRISNKLFWVADEKRGNYLRKHGSIKKLLGSIVCFGSQGMASSSRSECAICLEDFKKGEECLVFSICVHTFHCDCIKRWLEEKPNCPICRHCVPSPATMITNSSSIEFLDNLV